jgi:hypothetical protein
MTTMESSTSTAVDYTSSADNPQCSPRVKRMHSGLQQRLTMESSFEQHVYKCDRQANSPLWNTLPAELRYMVSSSAQSLCLPHPMLAGPVQTLTSGLSLDKPADL